VYHGVRLAVYLRPLPAGMPNGARATVAWMEAVRAVEVDDPDAIRLVEAYFTELRERFGGFTPPSRAELRADAIGGAVLIVYDGDSGIACGSLRLLEPNTGEVKRMFVAPEARGKGWGRLLLRALEDRARAFGWSRVVLDTAAVLEEAARLYLREGYAEIPRYNDNPYAARWFRKDL
jgi:GNAT superfamily N-acetyltransferase